MSQDNSPMGSDLFLKGLIFLSIASSLVYYGIMLFNNFGGGLSSLFSTTYSSYDFFRISIVPSLLLFIVLFYIILSLYQQNEEKKKQIEAMEKENSKYKEMLKQSQYAAAFVMQTISKENLTLQEWVMRRRISGQAPRVVEEVTSRIAEAADLFSRTFFLLPYTQKSVEVPVVDNTALNQNRTKLLR